MATDRFSTSEAAAYVGVAVPTLKAWHRRGVGPAWLKLERRVVYNRADLDEYMAARRRGGDSNTTAFIGGTGR